MISDITLGQYFPGFSSVHKLDPRTKILLSTCYIVCIFLANNLIGFTLLSLFTLALLAASKISLRVIAKSIKPLVFILLFTSLLNVFMTKGEGAPLAAWWIFEIYTEGLVRALYMTVRVILLIVGTSLFLTYTTSPISLTDGLESLLHPLTYIHVPVHIFSMMMSIALRFIPTLIEETEKIMNAQKSRGADFSTGGLIKRAKALIPLLVPLFVSAFKRAEELATAMECRCYRVDKKRTKLVKLSFRARDLLWGLLLLALLGAVIASRVIAAHPLVDALWYNILTYSI